MTKIAVIGAGITGVTTAYALSLRGYDVTVFDRHRYPAMATSYANGGQLSASNAEVWNSWGTVLKGLKWMFRPEAPFLLNPLPTWHKLSWFAEFIANIPKYGLNTVETTRLAIAARQHLLAWAETEKIDFDWQPKGILHVYRREADLAAARRVNAHLTRGGLERVEVSRADIRRIEPAIAIDCLGGFYTASDSTGDIHKYTRGLADAAARRGVCFVQDAEVLSLAAQNEHALVTWRPAGDEAARTGPVESSSFDGLVICAGVASRAFAAMLGDRINIYPVKGYSITVPLEDEKSRAAAPYVSLLDDAAKIVTSRLGPGRLRVAGTAEFNGENYNIRNDRILPLTNWVRTLFPSVATDRVIPWAGLRPMTPSMLPKVGPGRRPRVFYNTGHGHLGWTLSAGTAEAVAASIAGARL
ncbi:D-amino acid dehydrogenase [Ferrovibrio sp. MS7]|uniref:D-amino acid dehydrogenase n=1 Tax=Ferrovibrio plantarum TaxID=3119164 RepID=UPI0031357725